MSSATVHIDQRKSSGSSTPHSTPPTTTKTRHPFFVPRRRPRSAARRRGSGGLEGRTTAAIELNNAAVTLLESGLRDGGCEESAIDALRDSIEVLSDKAADGASTNSKGGCPTLTLAWAEARLELASREAKEAEEEAAAKKEKSRADDQPTSSSPFLCARPIRMRSPRLDDGCGGSSRSPSLQGLLSVISYNLGLAHQLLGGRLGRQALINKATQFYKKSEAIVLSIADAMEEDDGDDYDYDYDSQRSRRARRRSLLPPGVDVTYLARAIVNNMGLILFEWGEPDAGREYFDGLNAISVDYGRCKEEEEEESKGAESRWHVFAVNVFIARGTISSSAA